MTKLLNGGLRLMIYDSTDTTQTWKELRKALPYKYDDIIDEVDALLPGDLTTLDIDLPWSMTQKWVVGGLLYRMLRSIDYCEGFPSWGAALKWIAEFQPDMPISQIQYWGHGSPGKARLGHEALQKHSLATGQPYAKLFERIKTRFTEDTSIWFRVCTLFAGEEGREFGRRWANRLGCRIVAHTHVIGWYQSGGHIIRPGEEADWDPMEGILKGTPNRIKKAVWSERGLVNTINCLNGNIPTYW